METHKTQFRTKMSICHCTDVEFGSYDNQVSMLNPWTDKLVCIDVCIATEIGFLWNNGVKTLNSCCGHNIPMDYIHSHCQGGSIVVEEENIQKMKELGYMNLGPMIGCDCKLCQEHYKEVKQYGNL